MLVEQGLGLLQGADAAVEGELQVREVLGQSVDALVHQRWDGSVLGWAQA